MKHLDSILSFILALAGLFVPRRKKRRCPCPCPYPVPPNPPKCEEGESPAGWDECQQED